MDKTFIVCISKNKLDIPKSSWIEIKVRNFKNSYSFILNLFPLGAIINKRNINKGKLKLIKENLEKILERTLNKLKWNPLSFEHVRVYVHHDCSRHHDTILCMYMYIQKNKQNKQTNEQYPYVT